VAQVINTNIASLNAQRNLNTSQNALATSLQRLSTGLRINSAKDDAAGLAISERFTSQIQGLNQASRNANDGISFSQTAEGALATVGDGLQRIRELAVQAANDSNSASDRQALNNEIGELVEEVNRVALNTEFNGGRVLDGTQSSLFFQVGANQGQTIAVSAVDARANQLGSTISVGGAGLTQANIDTGIATISDVVLTPTGVSALAVAITAGAGGLAGATNLGTTLENAVRGINEEIDFRIAQGNADSILIAEAGYKASLNVANDGTTSIAITGSFDSVFAATGGDVVLDNVAATAIAGTAAGTGTQVNLTDISVATRAEATETIAAVTGALTQVSDLRAQLGAVQTRFESAIGNLAITSENLSAARSRILDADFAAETANLTRGQILQQAGTAILSQANALPQNVLSLLG